MIDEEYLIDEEDLIDGEDLKRFDQQDVTKVPREKVELWLCNEVQELAKKMITQCIDNLWKATLRKFRRIKPSQVCSSQAKSQLETSK